MLLNKQKGKMKGIWKILNTVINKCNEPLTYPNSFVILPQFNKILEKLYNNRLNKFIHVCDLLNPSHALLE